MLPARALEMAAGMVPVFKMAAQAYEPGDEACGLASTAGVAAARVLK